MHKKRRLLFLTVVVSVFLLIGLFSGCSMLARDKTEVKFIVNHTNVVKEVPFGTDLTLSGLEVKVLLADGTYKTLPKGQKGYSIKDGGYHREVPGDYTITVKYKKYEEVSFVITVLEEEIIDENENKDIVLKGIEVKATVGKKIFLLGEPFSTQDIIVEKVFSDGTREVVASPQYQVNSSDYNPDEEGVYTINIMYLPQNHFTTSYTVTVIKSSESTLRSITIKTHNAQTQFLYGEDFNAQGLIVEKHYDNQGLIETYLAEYEELEVNSENYNKEQLGGQTIVVTIEGTTISSTYTVQVIDYIASISVGGYKQVYMVGETFDQDMSVFVTTASGYRDQGDISEYTIDSSAFNSQQAGVYEIIVSRENPDVSTTFTVEVLDFVESISVSEYKEEYLIGEGFTTEGMIITVSMASGYTEEWSLSGFIIDYSGFNPLMAGSYDIIVTLIANTEITTSFTVRVE